MSATETVSINRETLKNLITAAKQAEIAINVSNIRMSQRATDLWGGVKYDLTSAIKDVESEVKAYYPMGL